MNTYSELKVAVANWLARDDLTATVPDFISLAEQRINRDLKSWKMMTRKTTTAASGDGTISLPADIIEMKSIYVVGANISRLDYLTSDTALTKFNSGVTGLPRYYSLIGQQIHIFPTPDADYDLIMEYREAIPALTDTAQENWALSENSDLYLYGSLLAAKAFIQDDARIAIWEAAFSNTINSINKQSKDAEYSGSSLQIKAN